MTESNNTPQRPITVLTVDDHPLLRDGIAAALTNQPDMVLVGEAVDGPTGIEQYRLHRPDVTLMDLRMPGMSGIDALRILRKEFPDARVIVLTTYRRDAQVMSALESGACGFLLKGMLRKELRDTIRAVHAGRRIIPQEIASVMAEHLGDDTVSRREIDVLNLAARGNSNREIAAQLGVTEDAIKAHMKRILVKLEAKDRTHAVMVALQRGILDV